MTIFEEEIKQIVRKIPSGSTMTYQEVAEKSGNKRAARAVANVMARNYDKSVPCHRVIRSDGTLGGYNRGGTLVKRKLLLDEGVIL